MKGRFQEEEEAEEEEGSLSDAGLDRLVGGGRDGGIPGMLAGGSGRRTRMAAPLVRYLLRGNSSNCADFFLFFHELRL